MTFRPFQDPQASLLGLQDEISRLVERVWQGGGPGGVLSGLSRTPTIDLYEMPEKFVLYIDVPGLSGDDIDVSYLNNSITIKGDRKGPVEESKEVTCLRGERRYGAFTRTVELPTEIDPEGVSAKCRAGVLEVSIPKPSSASPRSVKVDVAED